MAVSIRCSLQLLLAVRVELRSMYYRPPVYVVHVGMRLQCQVRDRTLGIPLSSYSLERVVPITSRDTVGIPRGLYVCTSRE